MGTATTIIGAIKQQLKAQGITYQELARRLQVSEATVKRDLARGDFTLSRLEEICDVLGVTIGDLANTEPSRQSLITQFTEQQERMLTGNPKLLLLTYLLVNQWKLDEILASFQITENDLISLLLSLDKLGIVRGRRLLFRRGLALERLADALQVGALAPDRRVRRSRPTRCEAAAR